MQKFNDFVSIKSHGGVPLLTGSQREDMEGKFRKHIWKQTGEHPTSY